MHIHGCINFQEGNSQYLIWDMSGLMLMKTNGYISGVSWKWMAR